mgnify:CR=1 FL=1
MHWAVRGKPQPSDRLYTPTRGAVAHTTWHHDNQAAALIYPSPYTYTYP